MTNRTCHSDSFIEFYHFFHFNILLIFRISFPKCKNRLVHNIFLADFVTLHRTCPTLLANDWHHSFGKHIFCFLYMNPGRCRYKNTENVNATRSTYTCLFDICLIVAGVIATFRQLVIEIVSVLLKSIYLKWLRLYVLICYTFLWSNVFYLEFPWGQNT